MEFYQSKLKQYSNKVSLSPEQMEKTRNKITLSYEAQLKKLTERAKYRFYHMHMSLSNMELYYDTCKQMDLIKKEIAHIKTLNTIDFYDYLINAENTSLIYLENDARDAMMDASANIEKYKSKEGIAARITKSSKKVEKYQALFDESKLMFEAAIKCLSEFQSLLPEVQATYIIGRCEVDDKCRFDREGFETFKEAFKNETEQGLEGTGNQSAK